MPFLRLWSFLLLTLCIAAAQVSGAAAQGLVSPGTALVEQQRSAIQQYTARTGELERQIAASENQDAKLLEIRLELEHMVRQLLDSSTALHARLSEINARLEQLGPAPPEGQPDLVAAEREGLLAEKSETNVVIGLEESLSAHAKELIERIAALRRELFRNVFTKRYPLSYAFHSDTWEYAQREYTRFYETVSSWFEFVVRSKLRSALAATFFALLAAGALMLGGRRIAGRLTSKDPALEHPGYISRLSVAFWSTLVPSLALGAFLGATLFFFDYFEVLRGRIGTYLNSLFLVIGIVFAVNRLSNAVLAPRLPNWRLISVSSGKARSLVAIITAMAAVIGLNSFLDVVNTTMASPLSLTIARSFVAAVTVGLLLVLIGFLRDGAGNGKSWQRWFRYIVIGFGCFIILAAFLGYVGLATFVSVQVVITGAVLTTAYLGFQSARAIGAEGSFAESAAGRWLASRTNANANALDQFGFAASLAVNLLVLLVFVPLILLLWGFQFGDIEAWTYRIGAGFSIGTFRFSPGGILTGVVVFIVGYFVTRWFQAWLDGSVLARGRVDAGVRNSIRTVVGYAGLAVAALIAISSAGIDLSNFALIAGGLSLGIGFGLQNIVSNFVSGLILLVERPFKAGDWVVAGDVSGTVRKISVRATEIETFQRQTVIMPNSQFINSAVGNWTHRNKLGRVDIKIAIAYGMDVKRAHTIMLEVAKSHPLVLRNPEPFVLFANFGPAALEFEMRVFVADILNGSSVQNDLRFAMLEAFDAAGIEIPSTPRAEVKKPSVPETEEDMTQIEDAAQSPGAASKQGRGQAAD